MLFRAGSLHSQQININISWDSWVIIVDLVDCILQVLQPPCMRCWQGKGQTPPVPRGSVGVKKLNELSRK